MQAAGNSGSAGSADATGWQDVRQQLFGEARERDQEFRLSYVLGQVQARLAAATRGEAPSSPKARVKALSAVVEGANRLIGWHRDELLAAGTAGPWTQPLPDTAGDILRGLRIQQPLFEAASAEGGAIDCADIIDSVAQLRGPESDAYFIQVLSGTLTMLQAAFQRIATDSPTASAALELTEAWEGVLTDVAALAPWRGLRAQRWRR